VLLTAILFNFTAYVVLSQTKNKKQKQNKNKQKNPTDMAAIKNMCCKANQILGQMTKNSTK
jgi:hypothetical protein